MYVDQVKYKRATFIQFQKGTYICVAHIVNAVQ